MASEAVAVSFAVVAAMALPIGTAISIYLDVKYHQQLDEQKQSMREADEPTETVGDEEMGQIEVEEEDESPLDVSDESHHGGSPPLRFPTVSAATARFGSSSYNIFVLTTTLHAACSQVFNYWFYTEIVSNDSFGNDVQVISILATIGLLVAVVAVWFMSLIPAKGKGTTPHIICGMIYFQAGIAWMIWSCMLTSRMNLGMGFLVVQAILCSFAMLAATWAFIFVHRTMKSYTPGTSEWKDMLHKGALGQFTFGILYSVFIIIAAVSVAT